MPQLTADALEGMHTVLSPPNNDSNVSGEAAAVINEYLAYIVAPHVLAHFKEMAAKKVGRVAPGRAVGMGGGRCAGGESAGGAGRCFAGHAAAW